MAANNPGPSYWEGAAPPSSVLGVGAKVPSAAFGPLSLVGTCHYRPHTYHTPHTLTIVPAALAVGSYCIHESNIFHQLSETTLYPQYVVGSLLVPISWGMHVAAWIQKKNGM